MNDQSIVFLEKYLKCISPTGHESAGQKEWLRYIKPYVDEIKLDHYGTAYGIINPDKPFKVVIEAHADEIGWLVSYITDDGFIYVIKNGGSDHLIAPAKRVNIQTKNGYVRGVFGWPAIHTRRSKEEKITPNEDNLFIDIGAKNKEEVLETGVHVGCPVTFDDEFEILNNKYFVGRALDNRLGGFCIAETARMIHEQKIDLPYSLYIVNSVQEEIGLRGAQMIVNTIKPNVAIITDVTHDTKTPLVNAKKYGEIKCGSGPSLTYAPAVHNLLLDLIISAAEDHSIPFQRDVASRGTGTDTDAFAYTTGGVPSALISIPLRYMHTTVEMAAKEDVENVVQLFIQSLKKIRVEQNWSYFEI
jgi:putative aminopeptidase FrvX